LCSQGPVGIYCPSRALAIMEPNFPIEFFDDDTALQGNYLPPFKNQIQGRKVLIESDIASVVIMSRTFGEKIYKSLLADGFKGQIIKIFDLIE